MKVCTKVTTGLQLRPNDLYYQGGFTNIHQCEDCDLTGQSVDLTTLYPCPNCGGKVMDIGAGQWSGRWETNWFGVGKWADGVWKKRVGIEK